MPSDNHQVVRTNRWVDMTDWERRLAFDPTAAAPLYHQLRERLRTLVRECEPETLLPTERALMAHARVSRATARRAIAGLVREGLLITRQGSGTYTAPGRVPTELGRRPAGFTETMLRLGRRPATRLIEAQLVTAPPDIANRLNPRRRRSDHGRGTATAAGRPALHARAIRHARGDMCSFFVELSDGNNALTDHSTADPILTSVAGGT
jgi:DNA-binding transcriptional regulator YhcF (GntR family)